MTPLWYWIGFHAALAVLLALEFGLSRVVRDTRRKAVWGGVAVGAGGCGAGGVLIKPYGTNGATQYLASYVLEQSLSIDNLFVFLLVFRLFRVPEKRQPKVLFWGVTGAMVMRGVFIAAGVGLLARFTGSSMCLQRFLPGGCRAHDDAVARERRRDAGVDGVADEVASDQHEHGSLFCRRRWAADGDDAVLALIAVELTDVVFALDSIPAVLSITRVPFLAYTSNIMAVMSLRSLYVLLALALSKLKFLHYGMGVVLLFAAAKMLLQDWVEIGPGVSLAVIAGVLGVTVAASLWAARADDSAVS